MGFRLTRQAEDDILAIAEIGLRLFGPIQARDYHNALFDMFELLGTNPFLAHERVEIHPPVRLHPFRAHLIVYMVDSAGEVLIVRVRHGHEDWPGPAG